MTSLAKVLIYFIFKFFYCRKWLLCWLAIFNFTLIRNLHVYFTIVYLKLALHFSLA